MAPSGERPGVPSMDLLLPGFTGASVPAHRLAALQASGGVTVLRPVCHHRPAALAGHRPGHAGHAVLLRRCDGL